MAARARDGARFLRLLVVGMVAFFGLGTAVGNLLALLATEEARAELGPIPYPLFWFHLAVGCIYLVIAVGIARRRPWSATAAWGLAVLHALSASVLWLWYFAGNPVTPGALLMELAREGFWALIAIYLWRVFHAAVAADTRR